MAVFLVQLRIIGFSKELHEKVNRIGDIVQYELKDVTTSNSFVGVHRRFEYSFITSGIATVNGDHEATWSSGR